MNSSDNIITSIANEKMKRIRALALKKNRDAERVFVVEGAEHILKALAHGWQVETLLYTSDAKNQASTQAIIRAVKNAAAYEVNNKVASYVSNRDNAQSVIAVFGQKYHGVEVVADGLWLGLEGVRDSGNLGSIIRTGDAVGAAGIMLIGNTCDAFAPEVIRATTGSFSAVKLVQISAAGFLTWRKGYAGTIIGTHLYENAVDYREVKAGPAALLLMGGEQAGLSAELAETCDMLAKIPMRDGVESLNLAVSTAIMLYQISNGGKIAKNI